MSTNTVVEQTSQVTTTKRRSSLMAYFIYCEILKVVRLPAFIIPSLLFPTMFFAMFGLPNLNYSIQGISAGPYIMTSYGAYATMFIGLISFGAAIASERGLGWNKLLRATSLNPLISFIAKILMAVVVGLLALSVLFAFAILVGRVSISPLVVVELVGLLLLGMIPFIALGLCLGYIAGPNSAPVIANVVFLPLAFASGLFLPLQFLPAVIQNIALYLPSYHVAQLGWTLLGAGDGNPLWIHLAWLAGYTVVFLFLATLVYRRDEGKNFG